MRMLKTEPYIPNIHKVTLDEALDMKRYDYAIILIRKWSYANR